METGLGYKRSLKAHEEVLHQLDRYLRDSEFSCGAQLQDGDIPPNLQNVVYVCELLCDERFGKLYYAAKFAHIHVHCASPVFSWSDTEKFYSQCDGCAEKYPLRMNNSKKGKTNVNMFRYLYCCTSIIPRSH